MNTEARLAAAITARNLTGADVNTTEAAAFVDDIEAYEGRTLEDAEWDYVINNYSASGRVVC